MSRYRDSQSAPATSMYLATKSDTTNETNYGYPYSTAAGNLKITTADGDTVTVPVPANFVLPVLVARVWDTGTMAEDVFLLGANGI